MPFSISRYELLRTRLGRFTRILHGADKHPERSLHRTRVATRRLRELLPVLQLEGRIARDLAHRLKKITERLGRIRELDVLQSLIEELRETGRYDVDCLVRLTSAVSKERAAARERLRSRLPPRDLRRVSSKLEKICAELAGDRLSLGGRTRASALKWAVDARIHHRAETLR